jgi:hypothetical protein
VELPSSRSKAVVMPWKPVTGQSVLARLEGRIRELSVTAWNSDNGEIKVAWPLPDRDAALRHRFPNTKIAEDRYEPLDPDAFTAATRG